MKDELDDKLGQQIRKELLRKASEIELPPVNEQWEEFVRRYGIHQKRMKRKYLISAAAILLLVMSVSFLKPSTASALGEMLYNSIKIFLGGSLYNINTVQKENPAPPVVQRNQVSSEKELTLDEVQKLVYFNVAKPHYLPQGIELKKIHLTHAAGDSYSIEIEYSGDNQFLTMIQNNIIGNHGGSFLYDSDDANVSTVDINGSEGYLIRTKDGTSIIRWAMRGLEIELIGKIEEAELIEIAKSVS